MNDLLFEFNESEPYIFISYAHRDTDRVMPLINGLRELGFRVWFDAGIEVGSEWPAFIANHLRKCSCFIALLSHNYQSSKNCCQEISYALKRNRNIIPIYLEPVELDCTCFTIGENEILYFKK